MFRMIRERRAATCLVAILGAMSPVCAEEPTVVVTRLSALESAEDLAKWEIRGSNPPTRWELSAEHASRGSRCAKLVTPAYHPPDQHQRWPAVTLSGNSLPEHDWSQYEYLVFEAHNPGEQTVPLRTHVDGPGPRWQTALAIRPGQQTIRVKIAAAPRSQPVTTFHFFYADPHVPYTVYLDDVRLETCDLGERLGRLETSVSKATREAESAGRHGAGLLAKLRSAQDRVGELRRQFDKLVKGSTAPQLLSWQKGVRSEETRLHQITEELSLAQFEAGFMDQVWGYGWVSGVEKVFRTDHVFTGEVGGTLRLELATNEREGVQLVLRSKKPLTNVRVSVSDLVSRERERIDSSQIEVLPVGYVNTKQPPYHVSYVGWWPDPLLNFLPTFDLDAGVCQPVWLDVRTMPSQPSGRYVGTVTAEADGAPTLRAPIEVTVWSFAVPTEFHFPTAVTFWDKTLQSLYSDEPAEWRKFLGYCHGKAEVETLGTGEARRLFEIRRKCHDMLLAHRLVPDNIYRSVPPRIDDVQRWKQHGARTFNISTASEGPEKTIEMLDDYVPKLMEAGLLEMAYLYSWDETDPIHFHAIVESFGAIKDAYPTIPLITTASDHSFGATSGLDDVVDIFVPQTDCYGQSFDTIRAARARGRKVFWYTCMFPHPPYANWLVEGSAAGHRLLMGFMPHKFGCDGFLHYSMNLWHAPPEGGGGNVPWTEVLDRGPLTNSDGRSHNNYNGDGVIFYPGPDGPVPSIRLKCIRDGLEDYEYLWLLAKAVREVEAGTRAVPADWLGRARKALVVDASLVRSLAEYSAEGEDVLAARREIGALLSALVRN